MEPEISHRCASCGASIRSNVHFCPECGQELSKPVAGIPSVPDKSNRARDKRTKRQLKKNRPPPNPEVRNVPFAAKPNTDDQVQPESKDGANVVSSQVVEAAVVSHSKRQRVKDAAREMVEGNVRPRVEKLRHASSVVLEEAAAIDPSLRFILIAVFLFVVFIVLLALSFVR